MVLANGVQYRRLPLENLERFEGAGIYYAATELEARFCRDTDAVIVGGGNSAGQAAMFLSRHSRVHPTSVCGARASRTRCLRTCRTASRETRGSGCGPAPRCARSMARAGWRGVELCRRDTGEKEGARHAGPVHHGRRRPQHRLARRRGGPRRQGLRGHGGLRLVRRERPVRHLVPGRVGRGRPAQRQREAGGPARWARAAWWSPPCTGTCRGPPPSRPPATRRPRPRRL